MEHLGFGLGVVLTSLFFALFEIHIEGAEGWAAKLPTWRIQNRWTRLFLGNRPLTGYHLYAHLVVLTFVHLPFLFGMLPFRIASEIRIASFLIFFWNVEDFLWFVLNPAFGIRKFRREQVWWHAGSWWWIMPRDYWMSLPLAALLYGISGRG